MGIVIAPNQDMYFSTDSMFRPTGMSERITRDRFDKLCQYFHVSDISSNPERGQPGHDKLAHVRPFLEDIRVQCKTQYSPHCETSIDEAMVAYTGHLSIKQYLPLKLTKRGIKIWARADPHNGFLNDFQVYTGKTNNVVEIGLGERVFKDFTSVPLFQDLLENKTYACGTIRTNRKYLPPAITQAKLKNQGEMVIEQKEGSIVAWHDKRTVTVLSTLSNPLEMSSVKRRKKDGSQVDVPCPKAIQSHTAHMNGVDRVDQLRSSYSVSRRAAKWWKYLFWFLIDISIINGFIMMKESANHQVTSKTLRKKDRCQLHFRQNLVKQLIGNYRHKRKRESIQNKASEGLLHWPVILGKKPDVQAVQSSWSFLFSYIFTSTVKLKLYYSYKNL